MEGKKCERHRKFVLAVVDTFLTVIEDLAKHGVVYYHFYLAPWIDPLSALFSFFVLTAILMDGEDAKPNIVLEKWVLASLEAFEMYRSLGT